MRKLKEHKSIAVVIREMMDECEKIGRKPVCIKLDDEDYKRLFEYLIVEKGMDMYSKSEYETSAYGIIYHKKPTPKTINTFAGLPVEKCAITTVTWL